MFDYEKIAYEQRQARERNSSDSKTSNSSQTSENDSDEKAAQPPAYASIFYNGIDEKPLPPLPQSVSTSRRVKFVIDKPLPPLPRESRKLKRTTSREGEYAWLARNQGRLSEEEWDLVAMEKSPWRD